MTDQDHSSSAPINQDDMRAYFADLILELQQMASRSGHHDVASLLLLAYERASSERGSGPPDDHQSADSSSQPARRSYG